MKWLTGQKPRLLLAERCREPYRTDTRHSLCFLSSYTDYSSLECQNRNKEKGNLKSDDLKPSGHRKKSLEALLATYGARMCTAECERGW